MQHIDDLDDIIRALDPYRGKDLDRKIFKRIVVETLGSRAMGPSHLDFMWSVFDK